MIDPVQVMPRVEVTLEMVMALTLVVLGSVLLLVSESALVVLGSALLLVSESASGLELFDAAILHKAYSHRWSRL